MKTKTLFASLLCLILALTAPVFVTAQTVGRQLPVGWSPNTQSSAQTTSLNGATTYLAWGFMAHSTTTISSVKVYVSSVTGTLTSLSCVIMANSAGAPSGTALGTFTQTSSLPTGAGAFTFSTLASGSASVTQGTDYWLEFQNGTGTPASNFPAIADYPGAMPGATAGTSPVYGYATRTFNGTSWSGNNTGAGGIIVAFADGSYEGLGVYTKTPDTTNKIFGSNEVGAQFTSPLNVTLNVHGVLVSANGISGSPTGNLTAKIYTGSSPSLLATSIALPNADILSSTGIRQYQFSSSVQIPPNTVITVTEHDSAADSSAAYFQALYFSTVDSVASTLGTLPWGGTMVEAIYNGSTWSTANQMMGITLLLDPTTPFYRQQGSNAIMF